MWVLGQFGDEAEGQSVQGGRLGVLKSGVDQVNVGIFVRASREPAHEVNHAGVHARVVGPLRQDGVVLLGLVHLFPEISTGLVFLPQGLGLHVSIKISSIIDAYY